MRFVIFVSALVQLVIAADINALEFGDIIYYEPESIIGACKYRHVGLYVGNVDFPGKKPGDDVFHRVSDVEPGCIFSALKDDDRKTGACNFLDGYVGYDKHRYVKGSVEEMKQRINDLIKSCGTYDVRSNNCEQLATMVRYGKKISLQEGLIGELFCKSEKEWDRIPMLIYIREQRRKGHLVCNLRMAQ